MSVDVTKLKKDFKQFNTLEMYFFIENSSSFNITLLIYQLNKLKTTFGFYFKISMISFFFFCLWAQHSQFNLVWCNFKTYSLIKELIS